MAEPTRSGFTAKVAGRTVVVRSGAKSQTINVCTPANVAGRYEARYRLDPVNSVTHESDLTSRCSLDDLREWLEDRNARAEGASGEPLPAPPLIGVQADDGWLDRILPLVDRAIDALVEEFVRRPYRHRVEHSLHTEFVTSLLSQEPLREIVPFAANRYETQLVHKEWPETQSRKGRGKTVERRGLFDVAILSPAQVRQSSLDQFRQGRIAPPIVIELGLDYGARHLRGDIEKFENSVVQHGRLVHLTRLGPRREDVESTINSLSAIGSSIRGAYGYRDEHGSTAIKLLDDPAVREVR